MWPVAVAAELLHPPMSRFNTTTPEDLELLAGRSILVPTSTGLPDRPSSTTVADVATLFSLAASLAISAMLRILGALPQVEQSLICSHRIRFIRGVRDHITDFRGSSPAVNNSTSDLFSWAATFNKPGFKRVVETAFPGLLFHSLGDGSVLNLDAHWVPGWCCSADEGWNMFRLNQEEEDSYGQGTINTVASTATNVPIAAGQGPFSPVPQTYNSEVVWNTGGLFTAYTGAKLVYLDGGSCGTLPFVPGTSTYFPGQACGTFGGSATAFGSAGIGQDRCNRGSWNDQPRYSLRPHFREFRRPDESVYPEHSRGHASYGCASIARFDSGYNQSSLPHTQSRESL